MNLKEEKHEEARQSIREKVRKLGRHPFALLFGSLGFGGLMILFMYGTRMLIYHERFNFTYLMIMILIWLLLGYRWGLSMWDRLQARLNEQPNKPSSISAK